MLSSNFTQWRVNISIVLKLMATLTVLSAFGLCTSIASANSAPQFLSANTGEAIVSSIKYATSNNINGRAGIHIERKVNGNWEDFAYFTQTRDTGLNGNVQFKPPRGALQGNYEYRAKARTWDVGFNNVSAWSVWQEFYVEGSPDKPTAPYPLSPFGNIGQSDIVLRTDNTSLPAPASPNVALSHEFQLRTAHVPFDDAKDLKNLWTATVPAGNAGNFTEVRLTSCGTILGCTGNGVLPLSSNYNFRWRVRSTQIQGTSNWSRWRYFSTDQDQSDYWYIGNRVGSYQAGIASGDEASGLVASRKYPGIYWFIRDAGEGEDRTKLYAVKINPQTGGFDNIDGYVTKEIKVTNAENIDWESVTTDDKGNLWIGDIGDYYRKEGQAGKIWDRNNSAEANVRVYRVPEPNPYTTDTVRATKRAYFNYPDGKTYNAEATFTLENILFLVTKSESGKHVVFRFPRYLYGNDIADDQRNTKNTLTKVGELIDGLEPVTGASITKDGSRIVLTTASRRALIFTGAGGVPAGSSWRTQKIVRDLLVGQEPKWEYYYRSAAALEVDGILDADRGDYPASSQERLVNMQVEGAAWSEPSEGNLALISEFGKHVINATKFNAVLPYHNWAGRRWSGDNGCAGEFKVYTGFLPEAGATDTFDCKFTTEHFVFFYNPEKENQDTPLSTVKKISKQLEEAYAVYKGWNFSDPPTNKEYDRILVTIGGNRIPEDGYSRETIIQLRPNLKNYGKRFLYHELFHQFQWNYMASKNGFPLLPWQDAIESMADYAALRAIGKPTACRSGCLKSSVPDFYENPWSPAYHGTLIFNFLEKELGKNPGEILRHFLNGYRGDSDTEITKSLERLGRDLHHKYRAWTLRFNDDAPRINERIRAAAKSEATRIRVGTSIDLNFMHGVQSLLFRLEHGAGNLRMEVSEDRTADIIVTRVDCKGVPHTERKWVPEKSVDVDLLYPSTNCDLNEGVHSYVVFSKPKYGNTGHIRVRFTQ